MRECSIRHGAGASGAGIVDESRQVRLIKSEAEVGYLQWADEISAIEQRTAHATMHDDVSETNVTVSQSHGRTLSRP